MQKEKGSGSVGTILVVVVLAIIAIYYFTNKKADAPATDGTPTSSENSETNTSSGSELGADIESFDSSFSGMSSSDLDL